MILMISNASTRRGLPACAPVGDFVMPRSRILSGFTTVWAADNDAFKSFNEDRYIRMLDAIGESVRAGKSPRPTFVTMPDVVANHEKTLHLFGLWHRTLADRNLNRAFVLQDGIKDWTHIPWDYIESVFIGGSTEFKLGEMVRELVSKAKFMNKWVHMGRVNSVKRLDYARSIGCDSCDGSSMARFCNQRVPPMIESLKQLHLFIQ
jgi:hypothetical protein